VLFILAVPPRVTTTLSPRKSFGLSEQGGKTEGKILAIEGGSISEGRRKEMEKKKVGNGITILFQLNYRLGIRPDSSRLFGRTGGTRNQRQK